MDEKKLSIEWHSILRDLLRNAWVIVCAAVIGILGTYVVKHVIYNPEYTSTATVIVNSAAGKSNAVASLSQSGEIAQIYAEVFTQPTMEKKVCEYLGTEAFQGRINAKVNYGTNIMDISVTSPNPIDSYKEVNAILKVYPQITSSLYSNGVVSVLRPAGVPKAPSNSMTSTSVIKTAAVSMLLAVIMIIALSVFRDTVKNEESFSEKIDAKLIGTIPHERKREKLLDTFRGEKTGLLFSESAFTSLKFTENINKIASRLEYLHRTKGEKVFTITSVAENEGKSTVASNIAIALAMKGSRVVLLDLDGKKPALYKIFEQKPDDNYEFGNFLSGAVDIRHFKFTRYKKTNLFLALNTKVHKDYQKWFDSGAVERVLDGLRKTSDYVIIDTAPVSVDGAVTSIAKLSDKTLLTVRTDCVYAPVINDTILTLTNAGAAFYGCILNDVYEEVSLFNQLGTDETGYYSYGKYGRYGKYGKYSKQQNYSRYGKKAAVQGLSEGELSSGSAADILPGDSENGGGV